MFLKETERLLSVEACTHTQTKSESFCILVNVEIVSKPKLFDRSECKNCVFKGRARAEGNIREI